MSTIINGTTGVTYPDGNPQAKSAIQTVVAKTANYTAVAADVAKIINATSGTWTLTLTAAATLGNGWFIDLYNSGTGVITIDPDGSETIDGSTTIVVPTGVGFRIFCDGSGFYTTGRQGGQVNMITGQSRVLSTATASVSYTGAGFRPREALVFGRRGSDLDPFWIFIDQDRTVSCISSYGSGANTTYNAAVGLMFGGSGSDYNVVTCDSFDADGLTLNFTKTNSPTGTADFSILCRR